MYVGLEDAFDQDDLACEESLKTHWRQCFIDYYDIMNGTRT